MRAVLRLCLIVGVFAATTDLRAQIAFKDATDTGLKYLPPSESWGASIGDYDGDFWPDIYLSNHRNRPSVLRNNGNGTLEDVTLQIDAKRAWLNDLFADHHTGVWSDFDGDGDDDLMAGTNASRYHNFMVSRDGSLFDEAKKRLGRDANTHYSTWFDVNKDGFVDLFQGRDGPVSQSIYFPQNPDGSGTFQASVSIDACAGDWSFLADINGDQYTDYVCMREGGFPTAAFDYSDGSLTDITRTLPSSGPVVDAAVVDIDNDLTGEIFLLRGGVSQSVAAQHNTHTIEMATDTNNNQLAAISFSGGGTLLATAWTPPIKRRQISISGNATLDGYQFDFDANANRWNVSRSSNVWEPTYLRIVGNRSISGFRIDVNASNDRPLTPVLFSRSGSNWTNVTNAAGLNLPLDCKSVVFADFDNDMDQDAYIACGNSASNLANRILINDGAGRFTDLPGAGGASGGVGAPIADRVGVGDSVVTADFDNNGFMDLLVTNGLNLLPVRHRFGPVNLFLNQGNANHWIELELVGKQSGADATGARVVAVTSGVRQLRETGAGLHRYSQNHDRVHFGLGQSQKVDLSVRWPSGMLEQFDNVNADKLYVVTEGQGIKVARIRPPRRSQAAAPLDECGTPAFSQGQDSGFFVYKDCDSGRFSIRTLTTAFESRNFEAKIHASRGTVSANTRGLGLESNDTVSNNNTPVLSFSLKHNGSDLDGIDFELPASGCLVLRNAETTRIMVGKSHKIVSSPLDLRHLGTCVDPDAPAQPIRGESGQVRVNQSGPGRWQKLSLARSYQNPIVVMGPAGWRNSDPVTVRVRNVQPQSFEFQLDEWDYLDGKHPRENIGYLVMEAGRYTLADGRVVEAGKSESVRQRSVSQRFSVEFDSTPIVFAQLASARERSAASTRISQVGTRRFKVRLIEEEKSNGAHRGEVVHWIALDRGLKGVSEVDELSNRVNGKWRALTFSIDYSKIPVILAQSQSEVDRDPITVRYAGLGKKRVRLRLHEEQSQDAELRHRPESVGYAVLPRSKTIR